jgi:hypothetical protein
LWLGGVRVAAAAVAGLLLVVPVVGAQQEDGSAGKDDAAAADAKPSTELTLKIRAPENAEQQPRHGRSLASLAATITLGDAASRSKEIVITNDNLSELGEGGRLTTVNGPGASLAPLLGSGSDQGGPGVGPQQIAAQEHRVEELRAEYERMSELNQSVQDPYNPYSPHYRAGGVENPLQQKAEQLKGELDQAEQQLEQMRERQRRSDQR